MKFFYGYLILLGVASLTFTTAQDPCGRAPLLKALLLRNYDKEFPPHYDQVMQVNLGMILTKLRGLDLFKGTIQMNVWMYLSWNDSRLAWDPARCGNITELHLLPSEIWVPDITLYNSNSPNEILMSGVSAVVSNDGTVLFIPPMHLESTCTMDLTDYPYDQHNCSLKWGSWAYDASVITLDPSLDTIDLSETDPLQHPIWDIINTKAAKHTNTYTCCPSETFEDVTFSLMVRRRETHGRIASSVVTAWLILIVFLIKPSSAGERIVFAGFVFVALVILSAALSLEVPAYSMTRLGRFLIGGMLIVAIVSVVNGLIYRFFPKDKPGQLIEGDGSSPRVLPIIDIGAFLSTAIILGISTGALFV